MERKQGCILALTLLIAGGLLLFFSLDRPAWVILDGEVIALHTRALTTDSVLKSAGIEPGEMDRVTPELGAWVGWEPVVEVKTSSQAQIWLPGMQEPVQILSYQRIPGNLLLQFGIKLFPGDRLLWHGQRISPFMPLPKMSAYLLQYNPAIRIDLEVDGRELQIYSAAPTLAEALWENNIPVSTADFVSSPLTQPPAVGMQVTIRHALPITIHTSGGTFAALSPTATVGDALAAAGISPQGIDVCNPAEDTPLTPGTEVRLVRVHEESIVEQEMLPYSREYIADTQTPLDQERVITPGQFGVKVSRVRVRYEDEREVNRFVDEEWVASQPVNEQIGYGTQIEVRTLSTPAGVIEYWRAVTVYATSYSPCNLGTGTCSNETASGALLTDGIIAVTLDWYRWMKGQRVYVPGYGFGTIADTGGGIPGRHWIDLGYSDENFVSWHQDVTIYFLTPIPASIPYTLP